MATQSERSKAKRIRHKGEKASSAERRWLRAYVDRLAKEKEKRGAAKTAETVTETAVMETEVAKEADPQAEPSANMAPVPFPETDDDDDDDDDEDPPAAPVDTSSDGPADPPPTSHAESPTAIPTPFLHSAMAPAPTCGDPECPACAKRVGGHLCKATNKIVWDAIDMETAKGSAMVLLGIVGMVVAFITKREVPPPTDEEITYMASAVQKSTYRRLNALGAYDDLLMLGMALGMYANRARKA